MNDYDAAARLLDCYYEYNTEKIENRRNFTNEQLTAIYCEFAAKYSPEALSRIPKESVLDVVFNYQRNDSMVGILRNEQKSNPLSDFGHIGIPYVNNLLVYQKDGVWKTGKGVRYKGENISDEEMGAFCYDVLQKLCLLFQTTPNFTCIDDYKRFSVKIHAICPAGAWLHKYLHMIMPDVFPQYHTIKFLKNVLWFLGITPINNDAIVLSGQIEEVFHRMKHYHFYETPCMISTVDGFSSLVVKATTADDFTQIREWMENTWGRKVTLPPFEKKPTIITDEAEYLENVNKTHLPKKIYDFGETHPLPAPTPVQVGGTVKYPRDPMVSKFALHRAEFQCEYNRNHISFTRKSDGKPYTEAHHLIPISYQELFDCSLDVPANIVSLCSHCHNCIHYGKESVVLLMNLFEQRQKELEQAGISICLEDLLKMY